MGPIYSIAMYSIPQQLPPPLEKAGGNSFGTALLPGQFTFQIT